MSDGDGLEPGEINSPGGRRGDRKSKGRDSQRKRRGAGRDGFQVGGTIVRGNPVWNDADKWEEMEADLMEVADDLNDAPNMQFTEAGGIRPTPPAFLPDPAGFEEPQEAESNFRTLEEFFDSQDYARLRESDDWTKESPKRPDGRGRDPGFQPMQAIEESARSSPSRGHSGRESNRSKSDGSPHKPQSPAAVPHPHPVWDEAPPPPDRFPPALEGVARKATPCEVGSKVRIFGLTGREDLNGSVGEVMEWAAERGRWRVQLPGKKHTVSVKPENISVLEEFDTPTTHVPTDDAEPGELPPDVEQHAGQEDLSAKFLVPEEPEGAGALAYSPDGYDPNLRSAASEEPPPEITADAAETHTKNGIEEGNAGAEEILTGTTTPDGEIHNLPVKGIRFMWRVWRTLVLLSLLEFALIAASALFDLSWSPCRKRLDSCHSLHEDDCSGDSCESGAPIWAPAWPMASLVVTAIPVRQVLLCAADFSPERRPRCMWVALPLTFAVVVAGAIALTVTFTAGMHYASRCPMERSSALCEEDLCPMPPCRRLNSLSPCQCGTLEEAEMARALFLQGLTSCLPNEWYPRQMAALEELIDDYENFACVFGPLICTALAIGVALIMVQLLCCPLLLCGRWGVHKALIMCFAAEEQRGPMVPLEVPTKETSSRLPAPEQVPRAV